MIGANSLKILIEKLTWFIIFALQVLATMEIHIILPAVSENMKNTKVYMMNSIQILTVLFKTSPAIVTLFYVGLPCLILIRKPWIKRNSFKTFLGIYISLGPFYGIPCSWRWIILCCINEESHFSTSGNTIKCPKYIFDSEIKVILSANV